ncbi:MAG: HsdM family class I SAM-dependent methyltransferase [Myxococcota bacterium]
MSERAPTSLHDALADTFGADGAVVAHAVGVLYRALDDDLVPDSWSTLFGFSDGALSARQQKRLSALVEEIEGAPERARFFFAVHTYLALVLELTLRRAVELESSDWLRAQVGARHGGGDPFGWYLDGQRDEARDAVRAIDDALASIDDAVVRQGIGAGRDVFKALYEALIPRTVRRSLGEHYTPDWLAAHLVDQLVDAVGEEDIGRALDPSCGSGTFLLEVVRRRRRARPDAPAAVLLEAVTGYDLNPLAVLAARTNLLLCVLDRVVEDDEPLELPVYCRDALEAAPPEAPFDVIVGNPPWINWQGLSDAKRAELQPLWDTYGLFVHEGFDTILGKGKKEFATLFTAAVVDRYLSDGGRIAFVITQGVWKASGASEGFRRMDFGGQFELAVDRVEDLSAFKVFDSATTRTTTFVATRGRSIEFPVDYVYWRRKGRRARLDSTGTLSDALEHAERIELAAEPYDESAPASPWITARPAAIRALRRLFGESAYQARQGVNTGGGNAIFWMRVLQRTTLGGARVENILKGAKKKVEQVQAEIESRYLYPLVRGRDVSRWHAEGDRHLLMVQDPERRRGVEADVLRDEAPRTLAYLERFEEQLRSRSLFRRYFTRDGEPTAPWWSMFGVGEYTLLPWKVVWAGQVATHLDCAVIGPDDGQLTLPDQTAYYVGLETEAQADFLCGLLNSRPIRLLYRSFLYKHVSLSFIETLDLPPFDAEIDWMVQLADAAREARLAAADGRDEEAQRAEARVDAIACGYWGIDDEERAEVARSLERLG